MIIFACFITKLVYIFDVAEHRSAVHALQFATRVPLRIISDGELIWCIGNGRGVAPVIDKDLPFAIVEGISRVIDNQCFHSFHPVSYPGGLRSFSM